MAAQKPTVAIIGTGNLAQYLTEEFLLDGTYELAIISRSDRVWFKKPGVTYHHLANGYTKESFLSIYNDSNVITTISVLQSDNPEYFSQVHEAMLNACRESKSCKRLITSDFLGDIEKFPDFPRPNSNSRRPFRKLLKSQKEIEWTSVNQGWLMDYFVQPADGSKSYIRPFPSGWPIDLERGTCKMIGSGNEPVSWTATRDMCKAIVQLIGQSDWDPYTFVFGEHGTWNEALSTLEKFLGRKFKRIGHSMEQIEADLANTFDKAKQYTATIDEWNIKGATAVPQNVALKQREKFFPNVKFRSIEQLLEDSKSMAIV